MTQQEKFNETVGILVRAYLAGELEHKICSACAVGNIVAYHNATKPRKLQTPAVFGVIGNDGEVYELVCNYDNNFFDNCDDANAWYQTIYKYNAKDEGARQIKSTGYSVEQLERIECAFERSEPGYNQEEWMFNGLMAVVDVLAEIHGIDLEQKESAKLLFVK